MFDMLATLVSLFDFFTNIYPTNAVFAGKPEVKN